MVALGEGKKAGDTEGKMYASIAQKSRFAFTLPILHINITGRLLAASSSRLLSVLHREHKSMVCSS